ncbi:hypothetical protein Trihar35433_6516 [Trichoderma harzianum]|nr:hypothetical protein Trihar35433_6516 [Trichoderma harzianum]
MVSKPLSYNDYSVGWICALSEERTAATAMLDEKHDPLPISNPKDTNSYTLGAIGKHNVVVACLPEGEIGTNSAASVIMQLVNTFPSIKFGLLVGIGGGIPPRVRLGDIVVSKPVGEYPGVVQWDLGKATETGFVRTGSLDRPPKALLSALTTMKTNHEMEGHKISQFLEELARKWPRLASKYTWNDGLKDTLFEPENAKPTNNVWQAIFAMLYQTIATLMGYLSGHKEPELIGRANNANTKVMDDERTPGDPKIHYGLIASGNKVIKDGSMRDEINARLGSQVLCVEMEAAGVMNNFPCLVIRGICDYADSKKNDHWQGYAASIAAAFTKELLQIVRPTEIEREPSARDVLNQVYRRVGHIQKKIDEQEEKQILNWLTPIDYGLSHSDYYNRLQPGTGEWFLKRKEFQNWITAYVYFNYNKLEDQDFQKLLANRFSKLNIVKLQICAETSDVTTYIGARMDRLPKVARENPVLKEEIKADISKAVDGMFLLAKIYVDFLEDKMTINEISKQLGIFKSRNTENNGNQKGKILTHVYEQAIKRIRSQKEGIRNFAMRSLAWVTLAKRQITISELQHALATQDGMTTLSHDGLPDLTDIASACVGLLTIDKESRIIRLVHYTAHEYLVQTQNYWFPSAEEAILRSCLTYLSFEVFKSGHCPSDEAFEHRIESFPLFHYAANHWERHLSQNTETIAEVTHFLESQSNVEASMQARFVEKQHPLHQKYSQDFPSNMTGLHAAAVLGLTEATKLFLERCYRPDAIDSYNYTPLSWASFYGHEAVVELLVIAGANLEIKDLKDGRTPLMLAAAEGHEAVVKLLLEKGADLNSQDRYNQTSLSLAATSQNKTIIELLRQRGGIIDAADEFGRFKLSYCDGIYIPAEKKEHRHETQNSKKNPSKVPDLSNDAYISLLMKESDVDSNLTDDEKSILLSPAVEVAQQNVIRLLIEAGEIDVNETNNKHGITLLHWAARMGYISLAELIVNAGAQLEMKDKRNHMTALGLAIYCHKKVTANFLLRRGANVHISDIDGKTTLHHAAAWGELEVTQQLVDRGVDINARDSDGSTALIPAIVNRHFDVVRLLIERGADVNTRAGHGWTPLHYASHVGITDIIRLLIERGADVNATCDSRQPPIYVAARFGRIDAVRLLSQMDADINFKTDDGTTILTTCASFGHRDTIQALADLGADVNARSANGCSPLSLAIWADNVPTIEVLVGMDDIDINSPSPEGGAPIMFAKQLGRHKIIKILLQSGKLTSYDS